MAKLNLKVVLVVGIAVAIGLFAWLMMRGTGRRRSYSPPPTVMYDMTVAPTVVATSSGTPAVVATSGTPAVTLVPAMTGSGMPMLSMPPELMGYAGPADDDYGLI